jgi:hypothetical protein
MAINQSITIGQGEDIILSFTMKPKTNITGWTFEFTVVNQLGNVTKLISTGGSITNGPLGKFSIILTSAQTQTFAPATYQYDVWRTNAGNERILSIGPFIVEANARIP